MIVHRITLLGGMVSECAFVMVCTCVKGMTVCMPAWISAFLVKLGAVILVFPVTCVWSLLVNHL